VKIGDKVRMEKMWKYEVSVGIVEKITSEYVVVKWEGVPGHWHYTEEQAERLEVIDDVD
tara:strand:+ start:3680 stop:3856 length:177 start_codon:yes stop_codon:yes gene_type:complete